MYTGYNWFGKCRKSVKDKGGIVICVKTDFPIPHENLNSSRDDDFERFWILGRLNGVKTAIGTVYFPNDGVNKDLTDSLFYELLENCSLFASLGYEICLSGDFNGRCVRKCDFTGNTILSVDKQSYNGGRLRQFIEVTELTVVNSLVCCKGLFTRILNDQRSTIDYVLLSKQLANNVNSIFIDEDGQYDIHSEHVIISTCLCNTDTKETKTMSKNTDRFF